MRSALHAALVASAAGHGLMTAPVPREGTGGAPAPGGVSGNGIKLPNFNEARNTANNGCGGIENGDLGFQEPTQAYLPGASIAVQWDLTIPHDIDNLESGVRVAIHYVCRQGHHQKCGQMMRQGCHAPAHPFTYPCSLLLSKCAGRR